MPDPKMGGHIEQGVSAAPAEAPKQMTTHDRVREALSLKTNRVNQLLGHAEAQLQEGSKNLLGVGEYAQRASAKSQLEGVKSVLGELQGGVSEHLTDAEQEELHDALQREDINTIARLSQKGKETKAEKANAEAQALREYGGGLSFHGDRPKDEADYVLERKYDVSQKLKPSFEHVARQYVAFGNGMLDKVEKAEKALFGGKQKAIEALKAGVKELELMAQDMQDKERPLVQEMTASYDAITADENSQLDARVAKDARLTSDGARAKAKQAVHARYTHVGPTRQFDVREPGEVIRTAREAAGEQSMMRRLQETATRLGVPLEDLAA